MKECHLPIGKRVLVKSAQTHAKVLVHDIKMWSVQSFELLMWK